MYAMGTTDGDRLGNVGRWWVAFCSGWWLVGVAFGIGHAVDMVTRPGTTTVEGVGVGVGMGVLLPGTRPLLYAADDLGVSGLPVGFTAILMGAVVGGVVWVSLPLVLSRDRGDESSTATGAQLVGAAIVPYLAAWAGISYLAATNARGTSRRRSAGGAIARSILAYVVGAAVILAVGLVFL